MKISITVVFLLFLQIPAFSQNVWLIQFNSKSYDHFIPSEHFDSKAIERRNKFNIAYDETDFPVNAEFVKEIASRTDSLRFILRWVNGVTVVANENQIGEIRLLPFVENVVKLSRERTENVLSSVDEDEWEELDSDFSVNDESSTKLDILYHHIRESMNLDTLVVHGLNGKGIRIAVFDAGFKEVDTHPAFQKLRESGKILASRDFYSGKKDAYFHAYHGTEVLGCLGGYYHDKPLGAATESEYLLARTESLYSEKPIEEDYWMAAMEWADSLGADMISSSLGYCDRYKYADMDGHFTLVTQAANLAIKKGMVVVISNGNEGNSDFKYLSAPADADSVISVGASYPMIKAPMKFSSIGPNHSGVLKPEVSAPGFVVSAGKNGEYATTAGTSFSCPLVAGFVACMMQLHPDESNKQIKEDLIHSSHLYPYFDYVMGYGVPDASLLFHDRIKVNPTFSIVEMKDSMLIVFPDSVMKRDSVKFKNGKTFHYNVQIRDEPLLEYKSFILPLTTKAIKLPSALKRKGKLRIWFDGYLWEEEE